MHSAEFSLAFDRLAEIRNTVSAWVGRYNDKRLNNFVLITSEVITNLLKHSSPKADHCRIELRANEELWVLKILDNGGAFSQFDEKIQAVDSGFSELQESGMGLGLVKSLVDQYRYTKAAEDEDYNCYQFELNIHAKQTLAIIDDDPSILILLEAYLSDQYRLLIFESGQAAIDGLQGKQVDLVISDLNMPGIDGSQVRSALQRQHGNLPFIFLTGERTDQLHRLAIDDVLNKPIKKQTLIQSIERVLIRNASLQESIGKQLAPSIVNQLIPKIKHQPSGFHILLASRAAKSGGGDFVFQKEQPSGSLLLLADVMGHDQQAKFFVHAYQGFLQGICHGLNDCTDPAELLYALSRGLQTDDLLASSLLTALSIFCAKDQGIHIACAGHPAPKSFDDKEWQDIPVSGPLLGFADAPEYLTYQCPKAPIICFTDGLIENLSDGEQEEFLALLAQTICSPNPCLSRAMDYYDNKAGIPASDDMTLMVIIPDE